MEEDDGEQRRRDPRYLSKFPPDRPASPSSLTFPRASIFAQGQLPHRLFGTTFWQISTMSSSSFVSASRSSPCGLPPAANAGGVQCLVRRVVVPQSLIGTHPAPAISPGHPSFPAPRTNLEHAVRRSSSHPNPWSWSCYPPWLKAQLSLSRISSGNPPGMLCVSIANDRYSRPMRRVPLGSLSSTFCTHRFSRVPRSWLRSPLPFQHPTIFEGTAPSRMSPPKPSRALPALRASSPIARFLAADALGGVSRHP